MTKALPSGPKLWKLICLDLCKSRVPHVARWWVFFKTQVCMEFQKKHMSNVLVAIIVKMVWYPADSSLMFSDWQILKVSPTKGQGVSPTCSPRRSLSWPGEDRICMSLWNHLAWHGSMDSEFGITLPFPRKLLYHVPPYPVALLWKATQEIESQMRNPGVSAAAVDSWETHGMKCRRNKNQQIPKLFLESRWRSYHVLVYHGPLGVEPRWMKATN